MEFFGEASPKDLWGLIDPTFERKWNQFDKYEDWRFHLPLFSLSHIPAEKIYIYRLNSIQMSKFAFEMRKAGILSLKVFWWVVQTNLVLLFECLEFDKKKSRKSYVKTRTIEINGQDLNWKLLGNIPPFKRIYTSIDDHWSGRK